MWPVATTVTAAALRARFAGCAILAAIFLLAALATPAPAAPARTQLEVMPAGSKVGRDGKIRLKLRCASTAGERCVGKLRVDVVAQVGGRSRRSRARTVRFNVPAGYTKFVQRWAKPRARAILRDAQRATLILSGTLRLGDAVDTFSARFQRPTYARLGQPGPRGRQARRVRPVPPVRRARRVPPALSVLRARRVRPARRVPPARRARPAQREQTCGQSCRAAEPWPAAAGWTR
jgi:hypothetical protein